MTVLSSMWIHDPTFQDEVRLVSDIILNLLAYNLQDVQRTYSIGSLPFCNNGYAIIWAIAVSVSLKHLRFKLNIKASYFFQINCRKGHQLTPDNLKPHVQRTCIPRNHLQLLFLLSFTPPIYSLSKPTSLHKLPKEITLFDPLIHLVAR